MSRSPFSALLLLCHILTAANAESTVLSLFLGFLGAGQPMYGSVVGVTSGITSYSLQCLQSAVTDVCLFPSTNFPFLQGPSTAAFTVGSVNSILSGFTEHCSLQGTTVAICTDEGEGLPSTNTFELQTTNTRVETTLEAPFARVTITAGLSLLSGAPATAAPSITAPGASSTGAAGSSTSNLDTASTSSSTSSTTPSTTAGALTMTTATTTSASTSSTSPSKGLAPTAGAQAGSSLLAMAALGLYYAL